MHSHTHETVHFVQWIPLESSEKSSDLLVTLPTAPSWYIWSAWVSLTQAFNDFGAAYAAVRNGVGITPKRIAAIYPFRCVQPFVCSIQSTSLCSLSKHCIKQDSDSKPYHDGLAIPKMRNNMHTAIYKEILHHRSNKDDVDQLNWLTYVSTKTGSCTCASYIYIHTNIYIYILHIYNYVYIYR